MVKLGDEVRDALTNFTGIAISSSEIGVAPENLKDGLPINPISFKESRLDIITEQKIKFTESEQTLLGRLCPLINLKLDLMSRKGNMKEDEFESDLTSFLEEAETLSDKIQSLADRLSNSVRTLRDAGDCSKEEKHQMRENIINIRLELKEEIMLYG